MSLPITAVGPLNVLTKPIFTDCWAAAGAVESAASAAVPMRSLFMSAVLQGSGKVSGDLSGSADGPKALPTVAFRLPSRACARAHQLQRASAAARVQRGVSAHLVAVPRGHYSSRKLCTWL